MVTDNWQNGSRTNLFGQTFTVATSGTPQSITLNTAWTREGTCSAKIYQADTIATADESNLIAISDTLAGDNCTGGDNKIFQFGHTGTLQPDTTYIWIYSTSNGSSGSDAIIGGRREEQYPYTLSKQDATLGRELNAYFLLKGDLP